MPSSGVTVVRTKLNDDKICRNIYSVIQLEFFVILNLVNPRVLLSLAPLFFLRQKINKMGNNKINNQKKIYNNNLRTNTFSRVHGGRHLTAPKDIAMVNNNVYSVSKKEILNPGRSN
jgi:hypothetical protein